LAIQLVLEAELRLSQRDLTRIMVAKAARVSIFGLVSIMTPVYMATLGYSPFLVGIGLAAIVAGNIFSNIVVVRYGKSVGRRSFLLVFSFLMLISGVLLFSTTVFPVVLLACFLGNISTTGTEAGPFQSIEAGILPNLVSDEGRNRIFGIYNLIG
jgi:MFS family permease